MDKVARIISSALLENKIIAQNDYEICRYGVEYILISVLEILSVLILAAIMRIFQYTVLYFTAFIPVRIYIGGYHADTRMRCFGILLGVYAVFAVIMKYISLQNWSYIIIALTVVSVICVSLWAPLKHKNKNITEKERIIYRKISIGICILESGIIIFMILINKYNPYIQAFSLGLFTAVISLIAGKIKSLTRKEAENNE